MPFLVGDPVCCCRPYSIILIITSSLHSRTNFDTLAWEVNGGKPSQHAAAWCDEQITNRVIEYEATGLQAGARAAVTAHGFR